jgi:hypothetical protein
VPSAVVDRHLAAAAALGQSAADVSELLRAEGFAAVEIVAATDDGGADEIAIAPVRRPPIHP